MPPTLKNLYLIHFWGWMNSLFSLLALWGNKNWPPSMKVKKVGKFPEQKGFKGMHIVQLECPRHRKPTVSSAFGSPDFRSFISFSAMLPDLVLFKGRHISWKKEQQQGFFQPRKNNIITIFSKIFKNSEG